MAVEDVPYTPKGSCEIEFEIIVALQRGDLQEIRLEGLSGNGFAIIRAGADQQGNYTERKERREHEDNLHWGNPCMNCFWHEIQRTLAWATLRFELFNTRGQKTFAATVCPKDSTVMGTTTGYGPTPWVALSRIKALTYVRVILSDLYSSVAKLHGGQACGSFFTTKELSDSLAVWESLPEVVPLPPASRLFLTERALTLGRGTHPAIRNAGARSCEEAVGWVLLPTNVQLL